jgi:FkbM family methyltransferase
MDGRQKDEIVLCGTKEKTVHEFIKMFMSFQINIKAFAKINSQEISVDEIDGIPIVSIDDFLSDTDKYKFVLSDGGTIQNLQNISALIEKGMRAGDLIYSRYHLGFYDAVEYFDKDIACPVDNEVFIDGGCYDGLTCDDFVNWCGGKYERIYSFEPDPQNAKKCRQKLQTLNNAEFIEAGLWSKKTKLPWASNNYGSRIVNKPSDIVVDAVSLDEFLKGKRATFIKLDVEGAELEALKGARKTIKKYKPKLAVCLYHKAPDIIDLPLFILNLVPDYKLYIRHWTNGNTETVLLAV